MKRNPLHYLDDLYYGATKYPCGWLKPEVVWGTFPTTKVGDLQKSFFYELRAQGFKRTPWQLVFPGQIAGVIKTIPPETDGINEYHVRFYNDGIIDCELEFARFHSMHWAGPRRDGTTLLHSLIDNAVSISSQETKTRIKELFGSKDYSKNCLR